MEIGRWSWRLTVAVAAVTTWWQVANADPQTNSLGSGCSSVTAKNASQFMNNLNATFSDLRTKLLEEKRFATAEYENFPDPVYGMAQCRNYMSEVDCVACYDAAVAAIRTNCSSNVTGARAVFDGCFLRYEGYKFYARTSENWLRCGNGLASEASAYVEEGGKLLNDLQLATPRMIGGYFGASKRKVLNSTNIYGVAQCAETVSQAGCQGSSINEKAVIGGAVGGAGLLIIVVTIFIWFNFSRTLRKALVGNILGATELQRPNRYSYKDLKAATDNFSEENKLGEGAFGAVYKATLTNETVVAVKKLDISNSRAKADFETEVRLISNVHHRNLVRLLGCCSKGSELLLVYEYMKNASLDRFLYGENRGTLSWKQRCDIIFGIARGIAYLHENYHITIIHRDIKPSNILLDDEFQAKIADFGLARLLPESQSHVSTKFAGTLGYTAPEYAIHGHLSEKVDIYSFGIVILEVAWKLYERGMHENLADKELDSDEYDVEDMKKMVEIALLCVQSPPSLRPTMSQLIMMILSEKSIGLTLRRPSFSYGNAGINDGSLPSSTDKDISAANSDATASFTHFTGR
ncbi:hypothetical protein C2S52_021511 [Perilla frutescens var. hirtella]|nr:hypothetical protein C2S52_021511 [Perilla frutescens var. hirtella]KAH6808048.1 hypothetical protein C2S51_029156 [Perilla frutescens var. frutescens]